MLPNKLKREFIVDAGMIAFQDGIILYWVDNPEVYVFTSLENIFEATILLREKALTFIDQYNWTLQ